MALILSREITEAEFTAKVQPVIDAANLGVEASALFREFGGAARLLPGDDLTFIVKPDPENPEAMKYYVGSQGPEQAQG